MADHRLPLSPRVSVLLPNYNNGRQSARDGKLDFMEQLLQSLWDTLHSDPTPVEILAADDGSTDDSLPTLRRWRDEKRWPDGRPFIHELIEQTHHGILAKTSNLLFTKATGDVLVRLDGDIACLTPHWATKLCETFKRLPERFAVVGPKQLRADGKLHAFGDFILHPKGYIHVGTGLDRFAIRHPLEVDHVMGAFYCIKRSVFEEVGPFDETLLRGQTIDYGLRVRLAGHACVCVPHIEFVHYHGFRPARTSTADTEAGVQKSLATFEKKWGFNRVAADLDAIRARYAGTPLLWNPRFFAGAWDHHPYHNLWGTPFDHEPVKQERSDWMLLSKDDAVRQRIELRAKVALDVVRQRGKPKLLGLIGGGDGLIAHILAAQGLNIVSFESHRGQVAFARAAIAEQQYPDGVQRPRLVHWADPRKLPADDASCDLMLIFDQMERHPNPVRLLKECKRVLEPESVLGIVSQRPAAHETAATDVEHRYLYAELVSQLQACHWAILSDVKKDDPARDMVLFAANRVVPAEYRIEESAAA
jgi:GT2 family glycosyltransferase/SAM-dependent methyltransferase